jgi:hypothetical protein
VKWLAASSFAFLGLAVGTIWKVDCWIAKKIGVLP